MIVQGTALCLPQFAGTDACGVDSRHWLSQEYIDTNFCWLPASLRIKLVENRKDQSLGQVAQR